MKGTTSTGFSYVIDKKRLDNYELLEAIGDLEENPILITKIVKLLLGDEQAKALKNHVKQDGVVSIEKIQIELTEIFNNHTLKK